MTVVSYFAVCFFSTLTLMRCLLRRLVLRAIMAPGRHGKQQLSPFSWATWQARMQGTNDAQRPADGGHVTPVRSRARYTLHPSVHTRLQTLTDATVSEAVAHTRTPVWHSAGDGVLRDLRLGGDHVGLERHRCSWMERKIQADDMKISHWLMPLII